MKKVILLIAFLSVAFTSSAQLDGMRKRDATETIAVTRFQTIQLNKSNNAYYLCITETGNRFDSPFLFSLGRDKEKSLLTLGQLINLCDELETKESVIVNNPYNDFE
ncbi:MAG: hypothetical protein K2I13_08855, partial [Alistipes sp.]|nr:hypothetical protein [Alistipes sp.]